MSDFNTGAVIAGKTEDVLAAVKVMRDYATIKSEQYREKRNCPYMMSCEVGYEGEIGLGTSVEKLSDEQIVEFIVAHDNKILINGMGPYGIFGSLSDLTIFEEMAEAAPNATISGGIDGFGPGGDMIAAYELKDGLMTCKYYEQEEFEDWDDEDCEEDWDDEEDWEDGEPEWQVIEVYDPVKKKYVK